MHVELILLIFFIARYLRKTLKTAATSPQLDKLLTIAMFASIGLFAIQIIIPGSRKIINWITYVVFGLFIYETYKRAILRSIKPMMYAIVPLVVVSVITDSVKLISPEFYYSWENYFNTALCNTVSCLL